MGNGEMVVPQLLPGLGGHPLRPGAVVPELGVLVHRGDDARRTELFFNDLAVAEAHGVVEWVALADGADSAAGALVPVLAVFLLQHAGGAKDVDAAVDRVDALVLRKALVDE